MDLIINFFLIFANILYVNNQLYTVWKLSNFYDFNIHFNFSFYKLVPINYISNNKNNGKEILILHQDCYFA